MLLKHQETNQAHTNENALKLRAPLLSPFSGFDFATGNLLNEPKHAQHLIMSNMFHDVDLANVGPVAVFKTPAFRH